MSFNTQLTPFLERGIKEGTMLIAADHVNEPKQEESKKETAVECKKRLEREKKHREALARKWEEKEKKKKLRALRDREARALPKEISNANSVEELLTSDNETVRKCVAQILFLLRDKSND